MHKRMKVWSVLAAALGVAVSGGAIAMAAIPNSDGSITVCYARNGSLRVIDTDAGETCKAPEIALRIQSADSSAKAPDADKLDGKDSTEFLGATAKAADADRLDGKDSTEFLGATAKAADADRLDGLDSSQLVSNQCPGGYTWDGSLCWEHFDVFGFDLAGAANRCRSLQARLPLLSDFLALSASGISLGTTVLLDWTASSVGDDETIYINTASGPNMDGVRANATVSFVRCVKNPVNALGSP